MNTSEEIAGKLDHARHLVVALERLVEDPDAEVSAVLMCLMEKLTEAADKVENFGSGCTVAG